MEVSNTVKLYEFRWRGMLFLSFIVVVFLLEKDFIMINIFLFKLLFKKNEDR